MVWVKIDLKSVLCPLENHKFETLFTNFDWGTFKGGVVIQILPFIWFKGA